MDNCKGMTEFGMKAGRDEREEVYLKLRFLKEK